MNTSRRWHNYRLNEHYPPRPSPAVLPLSTVPVSSYFLCGFTAAYCLPRYHIYCDLSVALSRLWFHRPFVPAAAIGGGAGLYIFTITISLDFSPV